MTELDGFEARGNIKVLMATNRPDTLDPALMRPGRLDRKIEFTVPDLEGRAKIFKVTKRVFHSFFTLLYFSCRLFLVCLFPLTPLLSYQIHQKSISCEKNIRWELLARLCPNTTGAEIRSVCTEAGMFAIRARRKAVSEKDFLDAVQKVIKGYAKFSSTPTYMVYN